MKVIGKVWFNSYGVNEVVVEVEGSNESEVWTKLLNNELL